MSVPMGRVAALMLALIALFWPLPAGADEPSVGRALLIGVGCCTQCSACTYPDKPCRSPEKQIISMEAYGMVVSDVCRANNLKYYYGPQSISYTSCILVK